MRLLFNLTYLDDFVVAALESTQRELDAPIRVVLHPPLKSHDLPESLRKRAERIDTLPEDTYRLRDRNEERTAFWRVARSRLDDLPFERSSLVDPYPLLVDRLSFFLYFRGPEEANRRIRRWRFTHLVTTVDRKSPVSRCLIDRARAIGAEVWGVQHGGFFTPEHARYDFDFDRFFVRTETCGRILVDRRKVPSRKISTIGRAPPCPIKINRSEPDVWLASCRAEDSWPMRRLRQAVEGRKLSRPLYVHCSDESARRDWRKLRLDSDAGEIVFLSGRKPAIGAGSGLITFGVSDWSFHGAALGIPTICFDPCGHYQSRGWQPGGSTVVAQDESSLLGHLRRCA
jgi:hypothetical protein